MIVLFIILGAFVGWYVLTFVIVMFQTAYMYHMEKSAAGERRDCYGKKSFLKKGGL